MLPAFFPVNRSQTLIIAKPKTFFEFLRFFPFDWVHVRLPPSLWPCMVFFYEMFKMPTPTRSDLNVARQ
jgi:hypothetical protein